VYGWGSYSADDKHQFTPVQVKYLDQYHVLKLSGSQRTVALVRPLDQPEGKRLIVYGKFAPFVAEDQVKVFDTFVN